MNTPTPRGTSRRELAEVALVFAILIALFLFLADGGVLFTRPFWTDELHTVLLASRSSPAAVVADLANGADYGPPLLHLATWFVRVISRGMPPTLLRLMSLVCVGGALLIVYTLLRRRFSRSASTAAVLAVASHGLVVAHSFEGRFYGPWLLCAAVFAWSLSAPPSRRRDVSIGVAAVLLATVHWYGIVSLSIMMAGAAASFGRRWRDGLRLVLPAATGFAALLLCAPLIIGQRRALTVNTWVPEFTMSQLESLARLYWTSLIPALAALIFVMAVVFRARRGEGSSIEVPAAALFQDPGLVALAALALMPLALTAMSLLGQPSMWPRYAIPAALAWAPFVAVALDLAGRWPARVFAVVATFVWFVNFAREAQYKRNFAVGVERRLAGVRQAKALGVPVIFQSMHAMYAAASADWNHRGATSFLELPDSTLNAVFPRGGRFEALHKALRVERDVARVHSRRFGFPRLSSQAALDTLPKFVLVASDDDLPPGYSGVEGIAVAVFPHHRLARLAPGFLYFERPPAPLR